MDKEIFKDALKKYESETSASHGSETSNEPIALSKPLLFIPLRYIQLGGDIGYYESLFTGANINCI